MDTLLPHKLLAVAPQYRPDQKKGMVRVYAGSCV